VSAETVSGTERIAAAFAGADKRAALMPYMMGGFPDLVTARGVGEAYAASGADLIELGVPFSDPLADGPVIQAAGTAALAAGATVEGVLELGAALAEHVPVVVMAYANTVLARGAEAFAEDLVAARASGLIVPDLPLEEGPAVLEVCDARGLALVPMVAPTTPDERMEQIGRRARGFLYAVSVTGTTGERDDVAGGLREVIAAARAHTEVPVAVGFGISSPPDAVAAAEAGADGVIVGSRLVRTAAEADDPPVAVARAVSELAEALR
jgi:tryptophan synthase alpha chain